MQYFHTNLNILCSACKNGDLFWDEYWAYTLLFINL